METTHATQRYDVVVVGASIAGCTTATLLARAGLTVALVDKHSSPDAYKRLCGHYIQPSSAPVIRRLGLADTIEAAGGVRNSVDLWTRWGTISSPDPEGERPHGYSIRRSKLDPMIRRLAAETPGVEYMPGWEAVALDGDDDTVSGATFRDRAGRHRTLGARLVVGADGRNSRIARLAGSRERPAPNERFCYMAYFTGVELPHHPRAKFWALDPDVAIASPNDDGITLLATFLHKRRLPEFSGDRIRALRDLFGALPEPPSMEGAAPAGKVVGYKDYGIVRREVTPRSGVALVGDAALTCDPTMAIGCGFAFQSAEWLADAALPALAGEETMDAGLARYRRTHRRRLNPHHRILTADARARRLNAPQRMLFAAATRDPQLAGRFHQYAGRLRSPWHLLSPRSFGRAAVVNARHRMKEAT